MGEGSKKNPIRDREVRRCDSAKMTQVQVTKTLEYFLKFLESAQREHPE